MSARARSIALIFGAVVVVGLAALFARSGSNGTEPIADRTYEIAAGLRCPVCLNLSVADSPSRLAGEMRTDIEARIRAGESPAQIRASFVDRYGEWILLEPPRRGLNLIPWAVPIVALIAGFGVWVALVRRRDASRSSIAEREPTYAEREEIDRELAHLQEPG